MADRHGVMLFNEAQPDRRNGDDADVLTPTESIGMPEHYSDFAHLRKIDRYSKSGLDTPERFVRQPHVVETVYPEETARCALLHQPTTQILIGAFVGVLLGALLSHFDVSSDVSLLVNLPGTIFLQVLKCFVLPMIFTSLATGVADIVLMGKVSAIGTQTAVYFISFSFVSSVLSTAVAMLLRSLQPHTARGSRASAKALLSVECADSNFWTANSTKALGCTAHAANNSTMLQLIDIKGVILGDKTASAATTVKTQISDILGDLLPNNIFQSFQDGTLLSVITFAIVFGAAAVKVSSRENSPLLAVLDQMNLVFFQVIRKLIDWAPLFVMSLVAGSLSSQVMVMEAIAHVGVMVLGFLTSIVIFELVLMPLVLWLAIKTNPFPFMKAMVPAALFAFGCASSLVTLPLTLRCVESTKEVSRGLSHFVLTIGCSVHKNGSAMYYPAAMVFLVSTAEEELELGWIQVVLIAFVSLLGSIGTAPITNASLVVVYSVWQTVYPSVAMPASYSYLVAASWFVNRFNTACNVVGSAYVARIIAEQVDQTYESAAT